jgi:hypothetical protein
MKRLRRRKAFRFLLAALALGLPGCKASAQQHPPRFELGVVFGAVHIAGGPAARAGELSSYGGGVLVELPLQRILTRSQLAVGPLFSYNLTPHWALEAEYLVSPWTSINPTNFEGGRYSQFFSGVKGGWRWRKFGLFGKLRPGFVSYSDAIRRVSFPTTGLPIRFGFGRLTEPALDAGGVVEIYVSRRFLLRYDIGDTIVRYGSQSFPNPAGTTTTSPAFTQNNFEVTMGVALRFPSWSPAGRSADRSSRTPGARKGSRDGNFPAPLGLLGSESSERQRPPRFELGAGFGAAHITGGPHRPFDELLFEVPPLAGEFVTQGFEAKSQLAVGPRFTYNLTPHWALEAEYLVSPWTSINPTNFEGGRYSQFFSGVKGGWRWRKFGLFGKLRPGFVSYSDAIRRVSFPTTGLPIRFGFGRLTEPALDAGAVIEVYTSRRFLLRYDIGDTIIRYGGQSFPTLAGRAVTSPAFTQNNFQFSMGAAYRF